MTIQSGIAPSYTSVTGGGRALGLAFSDAQTLKIITEEQNAYFAFSEPNLQEPLARMELKNANDDAAKGPYVFTINMPLKAQSGIIYFVSVADALTTKVTLLSVGCGNSDAY